jgi:hypothetical protein
VEILSASPHVSISVNLDGENDNSTNDAKFQQANIVRMVKEKDLNSIQKFCHDVDLESPLLVSNWLEEQNVLSGADKAAVKDSRAFHRLSSSTSFHSCTGLEDSSIDETGEEVIKFSILYPLDLYGG